MSEKQVREYDKFMLRLPDGMREAIAERAKANGRSMNAEIVQVLEDYLNGDSIMGYAMALKDRISTYEELHASYKGLVEATRSQLASTQEQNKILKDALSEITSILTNKKPT